MKKSEGYSGWLVHLDIKSVRILPEIGVEANAKASGKSAVIAGL